MSKSGQLYDLQRVDLEIDGKEERLRLVASQMAEPTELQAARTELAQRERELRALEERRRELEWEVAELAQKITVLDQRLYGGTIRHPKELEGLQQDVESLKGRRRQREDALLELMIQDEAERAELVRRRQSLQQAEAQWRERLHQLQGEQAALTAALLRLGELRAQKARDIDASSRELYEALRATKQGRAVVLVERGMCQGCRITLPTMDLQRARNGDLLVPCSSCKRLLHVG